MNTQELPKVGHVLRLAEIIREVDGNHSLGASALAEAILSHPQIGMVFLVAPQCIPTVEQLYDLAAEHGGEPVVSMQAALDRWGSGTSTFPNQ